MNWNQKPQNKGKIIFIIVLIGIFVALLIGGISLGITLANSAKISEKSRRGIIGPQGQPGQRGAKGDKGEPGIQGIQGEKGPKGDAGPAGEKGPQGNTGTQGPPGQDGASGPQGKSGKNGQDGASGAYFVEQFIQTVPKFLVVDEVYEYYKVTIGQTSGVHLSKKSKKNDIWYLQNTKQERKNEKWVLHIISGNGTGLTATTKPFKHFIIEDKVYLVFAASDGSNLQTVADFKTLLSLSLE